MRATNTIIQRIAAICQLRNMNALRPLREHDPSHLDFDICRTGQVVRYSTRWVGSGVESCCLLDRVVIGSDGGIAIGTKVKTLDVAAYQRLVPMATDFANRIAKDLLAFA